MSGSAVSSRAARRPAYSTYDHQPAHTSMRTVDQRCTGRPQRLRPSEVRGLVGVRMEGTADVPPARQSAAARGSWGLVFAGPHLPLQRRS